MKLNCTPNVSVSDESLVITGAEVAVVMVRTKDWVTGPPMPLLAEIVLPRWSGSAYEAFLPDSYRLGTSHGAPLLIPSMWIQLRRTDPSLRKALFQMLDDF
jgi:hypothetical protein